MVLHTNEQKLIKINMILFMENIEIVICISCAGRLDLQLDNPVLSEYGNQFPAKDLYNIFVRMPVK